MHGMFSRRPAPEAHGILRPGRNVWRVARARRAAMLVDAAPYFGALRAAMREARHTIHIVGWDLDGETPFTGPEGATDGLPEKLGPFLAALVARRPGLKVRLLLWDHALFYVFGRDLMPNYACLWDAPRGIEICLDDVLPLGACHHQKIVVVDERVAFCGGIDLTRRRWDTPEHRPADPRRVDPSGEPYAPFHDVQMLVDGDAARDLGELVRRRWNRSACDRIPPRARERVAAAPGPDPWPAHVAPEFADIPVGIARTQPRFGREPRVAEVEALYLDMLDAARRHVYVENQYLTAPAFGARLAERLNRSPALQAAFVTPAHYEGWLLRATMAGGRAKFMDALAAAGCGDCVRLLAPESGPPDAAAQVMVHAKLMIVDDTLLRVGSSNVCNRSMGLDTECDLVLAAENGRHRAAIRRAHARLLGEHAGCGAAAALAALEGTPDLFAALDALADPASSRRLVPVGDEDARDDAEFLPFDVLADPPEALIDEGPDAARRPFRPLPTVAKVASVVLAFVALAALWQTSALAEPAEVLNALDAAARHPWTAAAAVGLFVAGGLAALPLMLMLIVTLAVFGVWPGAALAALGALASSVATYLVGRGLGAGLLRRTFGPWLNRIRRHLPQDGVFDLAAIRMAPIAPFFLVNLVAGATGVRFGAYLLGSLIGVVPDVLLIAALAHLARAALAEPGPGAALELVAGVAAWALLSVALSVVVVRRWRAAAPPQPE